jgi:hypothetical protein
MSDCKNVQIKDNMIDYNSNSYVSLELPIQ